MATFKITNVYSKEDHKNHKGNSRKLMAGAVAINGKSYGFYHGLYQETIDALQHMTHAEALDYMAKFGCMESLDWWKRYSYKNKVKVTVIYKDKSRDAR